MIQMSIPTSYPDTLTASIMFGMQFVTYSALVFHVWEWILGLPFEVKHIWKKPSSIVKWQYLWSRYMGIAAQIGNTLATRYIHSTYDVPRRFCLTWYAGQLFFSQGLLFSLEISLIHRLYVLSDSNNQLKTSLYALVIAEQTIKTTFSLLAARRTHDLIGACIPREAPFEIAVIASTVCATQGILWGLTIQHSLKKKISLTSLMMRDSCWVFGVVSIVIVGGTANVFAPRHRPVFNPFSAFAAALVSSNCRIIINLEGMPQIQRDVTSMIEFTSYTEAADVALETQRSHPQP